MNRKTRVLNSGRVFVVTLPRVVGQTSKVAHVVVDGGDIYNLVVTGGGSAATACHFNDYLRVDVGDQPWRWVGLADPDTPTCRRCLAALRRLGAVPA